METEKKYAIVTGGTKGIGYEIAKLLAQNGYNLVLIARTKTDLDVASVNLKQWDVEVLTISKNLFDYPTAYDVYEELKEQSISPEILVNDAGQGVFGEFKNTDISREIDIIHLNVVSLLILTKLFIKDRLGKKSGKILNVSSVASKIPGPWHSVYHGTKAFVQSFSEAIRDELKEDGITVTTLLPGPTATDFFNKANMNRSKILQEKLADPAEVAKDGYMAMMRGDDKIISGFKNKLQVAINVFSSEENATHRMGEMQKPVHSKSNDL